MHKAFTLRAELENYKKKSLRGK